MQHIFDLWQIIDIVLKLVLAVLCGGLVGLIKGGDKNSVSFSTLILTCFTSAFLVLNNKPQLNQCNMVKHAAK